MGCRHPSVRNAHWTFPFLPQQYCNGLRLNYQPETGFPRPISLSDKLLRPNHGPDIKPTQKGQNEEARIQK